MSETMNDPDRDRDPARREKIAPGAADEIVKRAPGETISGTQEAEITEETHPERWADDEWRPSDEAEKGDTPAA